MERHNGQRSLRASNRVAAARAGSAHADHGRPAPQPQPAAKPAAAQADFARVSAAPAAMPAASAHAGRADPNDGLTLPDIPPMVLQPPSLLAPRPAPLPSLLPSLRLPTVPLPGTTTASILPPLSTAPPPPLMPFQWPLQETPERVPPHIGRDWSGWRPSSDGMLSRVDWFGIGRAYSARGNYFGPRDAQSFLDEARRSAGVMQALGIPQRLRLGPLNLDLLNLGLGLQAGQLNARDNPNFMDRAQREWKWQNPNEIAIPPIPFFNRSF